MKKEIKKKPKKKRITIASAKDKGRNLQKWVCKKISELLNIEYGYEDEKLIQPRLMGQSGTDVVLHQEALKRFPYSVECKSCEAWSLPSFIRQAKKNTKENTDWLLVLKRKEFKNPVVVIDANRFFQILEDNKNNIY